MEGAPGTGKRVGDTLSFLVSGLLGFTMVGTSKHLTPNIWKRPFNKLSQAYLIRIAVGVQRRHRRIVLIPHTFAHAESVHIEGRKLLQRSQREPALNPIGAQRHGDMPWLKIEDLIQMLCYRLIRTSVFWYLNINVHNLRKSEVWATP